MSERLFENSYRSKYQKLYESITPSIHLKNETKCRMLELLYERVCKEEDINGIYKEQIDKVEIIDKIKDENVYKNTNRNNIISNKEKQVVENKVVENKVKNLTLIKAPKILKFHYGIIIATLVAIIISTPMLALALSYNKVFSYIGTNVVSYFTPVGTSAKDAGITIEVKNAYYTENHAIFYLIITNDNLTNTLEGISLGEYEFTNNKDFSLAKVEQIDSNTSCLQFVATNWNEASASHIRLHISSLLLGEQKNLQVTQVLQNDNYINGEWFFDFTIAEVKKNLDFTTKAKIAGGEVQKFTISPAEILIKGIYADNVSRIRIDFYMLDDSVDSYVYEVKQHEKSSVLLSWIPDKPLDVNDIKEVRLNGKVVATMHNTTDK